MSHVADIALSITKDRVSGTHGGVTVEVPLEWFGDLNGAERVVAKAILTGRAAMLDDMVGHLGKAVTKVGWNASSYVEHRGVAIESAYVNVDGSDGVRELMKFRIGREADSIERMATTFRRRPTR